MRKSEKMKLLTTSWIALALITILLLTACGNTTPAPTRRPGPTTTSAPPSTPTVAMAPGAGGVNFVAYEENPVLRTGEPGSWDDGAVFNAQVVLHQGQYHIFYNGADAEEGMVAIGYAVSDDGRLFTKEVSNPILEGDERGFDAIQVSDGVALVEDGTWVLYYNASAGPGPGRAIGRATAPNPAGSWSRRMEPVLRAGEFGAWDGGFITSQSVIRTEEGYVMYYVGGPGQPGQPASIGRATSADGVVWTKYDDPDTVELPFAESDPVLQTGPGDSWDSQSIWGCSVLRTGDGWEMFYAASRAGVVQIGYAMSTDGIKWTRYEENPVLSVQDDPAQPNRELSILESPTSVVSDSTYFLYYDYGLPAGGIGLATGTAEVE